MDSWNEEEKDHRDKHDLYIKETKVNVSKFEKSMSEDKIKNEYVWKILKYNVKFPFQPYEIQKDYMAKVIKAWSNSENALLESPTGTGKTLSLLCSSLAWLENELNKSSNASGLLECSKILNFDLKGRPKIIYASRTHSQLAQVIDELKSTPYKPRTSVIASREHLWIHPEISKLKGNALNIACNKSNADKLSPDWWKYKNLVDKQLNKDANEVSWGICDIEEMHKIGKTIKSCPYFIQKERAKIADLILMPYNYLIDPRIREIFEINYKNAIVIIDEAHNINSICESVSSLDFSQTKLGIMMFELGSLK